jgi:hypothetical protein
MRYELTKWPIDKTKRTGSDITSLEREIGSLGPHEQFQLWMFQDDGESACVLGNTSLAYLSVLPECTLAIDRQYDGPKGSTVEIYLENGQLDEMPRVHCIARQLGIAAGLHYFRTGKRPPFLAWFPGDAKPTA